MTTRIDYKHAIKGQHKLLITQTRVNIDLNMYTSQFQPVHRPNE